MASNGNINGLQTFPFREDKLVVITPGDHPLVEQAKLKSGVTFSEIISHDFVGLADGSALQEHLSWHAEKLGRRLKCRVRQRSFDGICQMVARRVGISILPKNAAERYSKIFDIRIINMDDKWTTRELLICLRNVDDLPTYGKLLVKALRA